tara:strand:+ start:1743 stop:1940 length:198 start_codon:yes stop_codon:yes gene_type:complete
VPLVVKDVANVLIPAKIQMWHLRVRYSAARVVTVAQTTVAHAQKGVIIDVQNVVNLQKKMSKVNI